MGIEEKCEILRGISECVPENGLGEEEEKENLLQNFLPLRSYSKLADQKVFLIIGGRGAGKTELFRIMTSCGGFTHIINEKDRKRYTGLKESEFLIGYVANGSGAKVFPASSVCTDWLKIEKPEELASFWGGLVCSVILRRFESDQEVRELASAYLGDDVSKILIENSNELFRWWKKLEFRKEMWESFLDRVDDILHQRGECVFITYDELDRICSNYGDLFVFIRGLLDFWYRHNSRFTNLKAKIFLRNDLYNAKALQFVDASKMGSYQMELSWNAISLYRLLVKRMANAEIDSLVVYLKKVPGLLQVAAKDKLGYLPGDSEDALKLLMEKMIGKYMGKTPKRGASYTWVPNHIQDANGEMVPRAFLRCFAFAAEEMLNHKDEILNLEAERVLSPTRLQGALEKVSFTRVKELTWEEYQWLQNLINRIHGKTMLMKQEEFLEYLQPCNWPEEERDKLPGKTSTEILEALLALGIVMKTTDGRINVPEIYLHGFGLKRKGGIKRTK
ncbi:MAG: hypothetical protein Q4C59_10100 [Lachnospiraceae bacterium]|nr:hypothetical protein [Lachnospiraceae bacterium]